MEEVLWQVNKPIPSKKLWWESCFNPQSVEANFYEANALPSELSGPGVIRGYQYPFFISNFDPFKTLNFEKTSTDFNNFFPNILCHSYSILFDVSIQTDQKQPQCYE